MIGNRRSGKRLFSAHLRVLDPVGTGKDRQYPGLPVMGVGAFVLRVERLGKGILLVLGLAAGLANGLGVSSARACRRAAIRSG